MTPQQPFLQKMYDKKSAQTGGFQTVDKPHSSVGQNGVCAFQDIKNRIPKTENGCLVLLRLSTMTISFPYGQLFQIHGRKFKPHPVCYLSEAAVVSCSW